MEGHRVQHQDFFPDFSWLCLIGDAALRKLVTITKRLGMKKIWESQLTDPCFWVLWQKLHRDLPSKNIFIIHHSSIQSNAHSFFWANNWKPPDLRRNLLQSLELLIFSLLFGARKILPLQAEPWRLFCNAEEGLLWQRRFHSSIPGRLISGNGADKADGTDTGVCRTLRPLLSALKADKSAWDTEPGWKTSSCVP